jgi:hypothetical protein
MRNLKSIVLPAVAAMCLVVPTMSAIAQTAQPTTTTSAKKQKMIKFTMQNKSTSPIDFKSGDQQVTLAAGESKTMKAPAGTSIVTTSPSAKGDTGTILTQVSGDMDGATVNLR